MCGVSGFVSTNPRPAFPILGMTDIIRHRGPDDEGFALFNNGRQAPLLLGNGDYIARYSRSSLPYAPSASKVEALTNSATVALGHRRLAIVDLSIAGHQPMCGADERYWIVFNGEIYNHEALRHDLEDVGYQFRSGSDTEVILAAYVHWGRDCLSRLNGMWAFAIFDVQNQELFLSRDRFGIKPLYYWVAPDGTFCFASEIKQFTQFPGWAAHLNAERAYDFLAWGLTDHTDETLFSQVYQLRPGHLMVLNVGGFVPDKTGRLPVTRWYELRPREFAGSYEQAAAEFKERLTNSVGLELHADVPVGSCLSGGLDSSSIVCIINGLLKTQGTVDLQRTFSAVSDVARFDESNWISAVVDAVQVRDYYVEPPLDHLFDEITSITWHQDEPFGSTSVYAQWNVFRLAAENDVKVMLDGQGADEQLAGYHGYFGPRFAGLLRSGRLRELWKEMQAVKSLHGYSELRSLMYIGNVMLPHRIKQRLRALNNRNHDSPSWLDIQKLGVSPSDPLHQLGNYSTNIRSMSAAQLTATNLQMLLHWEDRDSMAHSIEARVPFLDHELVEFVLGLPDEFKLHRAVTKRVQRTAMSGILPDRIRDRFDKMGFVTPEETWMLERAPEIFRQRLQTAVETSRGILNSNAVELFDNMLTGKAKFSFAPWRMISFGEWMRSFQVEVTPR